MSENVVKPAITEGEKRLLEVRSNPENRLLSIKDQCDMANISTKTYQRAVRKKEYLQAEREACSEIIQKELIPIVHTFINEAKNGSFQHGKVILEMGDLYTEKQKKEITGKDGEALKLEVDVL